MNTIQIPAKLLNDKEVAQILGLSVATIRRRRMLSQGPPFLKIGASVRYSPDALQSFINSRPGGGSCLEVS